MLCRLLILFLLCTGAARAESAMRAERLQAGEQIKLDGRLDHPAWQRAPVYDRFVEKVPTLGAVPPQATRVQMLFDDRALYVGVTALDGEPGRIRAPLVRYDQVNRTQDFVVVYLDPIGSRQAAQFFRVNAAGSLADGMHTAADDSEDFAPDFDWDAAVQRTPEGWTAVLRLPFGSLRFSEDPAATWRVMVARRIPREQFHMATSVTIPREAPSFIDTMQPLDNVRLPERHQFLTLRPSLTIRHDGSGTHADASLDLKWRARAELVIDGTLNPDFSQVDLDVPQLSGNQRFALFVTEKRPFFFESSDLLRSPTDALYTRSLTAPRAGLRATWRGAGLAGSAFAIDDRGGGLVLVPGPYGTGFAEQPASRVIAGRMQADRGRLQGGMLLAARRYDEDRGDNTVLGPDIGWRIDDNWRVRGQWLHSRSTARADGNQLRRGPAQDGDRVWAKAFYNHGMDEFSLGLDEVTAGFRHDTGFVSQAGIRKVSTWLARGWPDVAGLNEFWVNTEAWQVQDKATGRVIERKIRPGLWMTGPRNLEIWAEAHLDSRQRLSAVDRAPLLSERYLHAGILLTPAPWWNFAEASVTAGRMVDAVEGLVRDGRKLYLWSQVRVLPSLELEPSWNLATLAGEGRPAYRETAGQLLAVWHLGPRSHLRAILQRSTLERGGAAEPPTSTASLTWSLRRTAGTVLYVGASRAKDGAGTAREAFVKLQVDMAEARALF